MAADDLPEKFDVVVIGTGLLESIIAAAFARVGHSVLHIDRNDYYCGDWASFNLHGLEGWAEEQQVAHPDPLERPEAGDVKLQDGDVLVDCPLYNQTNTNIETGFLVSEEEPEIKQTADESTSSTGTAPGESPAAEQSTSSTGTAPGESPAGEQSTSSTGTAPGESPAAEQSTSYTGTAPGESPAGDTIDTLPDVSQLRVSDEDRQPPSDHKMGAVSSVLDSQSSITTAEQDFTTDTKCSTVSETGSEQKISDDVRKTESSQNSTEPNQTETGADPSDLPSPPPSNDLPQAESGRKIWTRTGIEKEWRKFNIDLAPRLLYCRGDMVELLINSDVSKYCEFKTVTRVLTWLNAELQKVPCSRADVFSSKSVSMIEKRMMMKFITFCMEYQKHPQHYQDFADKPFTEFLNSRKLKPNIRHFIQHSIAMATDTTTTIEGLEKTQKFILSLGRYGNTAFLWPLYGSGELPQSFARMCAVFGGIYCLRMTASSLIVDQENNYRGIVTTEGHRIESKWLVCERSYLPKQFLPSGYGARSTSRAILMTDKSIQPEDSEQLTLIHLPSPDDPNRPVSVLELGPSSMACPQGMYLVHLSREGAGTGRSPRDDLQYAVDLLFSEESKTEAQPSILWYLYFSQTNSEGVTTQAPDHIVSVPGPGSQLDMDQVVKQAKELFAKICPDEEFLPKAPNPEDIIFDDGNCREAGEGFQAPPSDVPGDPSSVQAYGDSQGLPQTEQASESEGDFQTGERKECKGSSQTDQKSSDEGNSLMDQKSSGEGNSQMDQKSPGEGNSLMDQKSSDERNSLMDQKSPGEGNSQMDQKSLHEGNSLMDQKSSDERNSLMDQKSPGEGNSLMDQKSDTVENSQMDRKSESQGNPQTDQENNS